MRLVFATPPSWRATDTGFALGDGLEIESSPVAPLPDDPVSWARTLIAEPPPARLELVVEREIETRSGWPALVFDWRVTVDARPARKLVFHFQLLEYGAAARVRAPEELYLRHERELLRVLVEARVEWDSEPLTFAGIWRGFDPG